MERYVLTGGPCSGKTTIVNQLREKGYNVLDEVARGVLEANKNIGMRELEVKIFNEQVKREGQLESKCEKLFLDRGVLDVIAYSNFYLGEIPSEFAEINLQKRYDKVFVLERLPFKDDGLRIENGNGEAKKIHNELISTYKKYNYEIVNVPVLSIEERTNFVLERVENA